MHEQMFRELAERVEEQVALPDLTDLERRGRARRRNRLTVTAAAASALLLAGGLAASLTGDERTAPPVDRPVPTTPLTELDGRPGFPSELQGDREYFLDVWLANGEPQVRATLTPPADGWSWRGDTATRTGPGDELGDLPRVPYAEVGVIQPTRVPVSQCSTQIPFWQQIAASPAAVARQIASVPRAEVLQPVREDGSFGYPGAHVRLVVPELCREWNDVLLWSQSPAHYGGDAGVGTVLYPGQVLDVWVVDVEGTLVLVHLAFSPDLPAETVVQAQELLRSVDLEPLPVE